MTSGPGPCRCRQCPFSRKSPAFFGKTGRGTAERDPPGALEAEDAGFGDVFHLSQDAAPLAGGVLRLIFAVPLTGRRGCAVVPPGAAVPCGK